MRKWILRKDEISFESSEEVERKWRKSKGYLYTKFLSLYLVQVVLLTTTTTTWQPRWNYFSIIKSNNGTTKLYHLLGLDHLLLYITTLKLAYLDSVVINKFTVSAEWLHDEKVKATRDVIYA